VSRLSPERVATAQEIIGRYPVVRSALIPVLHLAQEQDGYVAADAMEHIGELIGCSPAEVYGTASFYEMFVFEPIGKYKIDVCTNISCMLDGAYELLHHAEEKLGIPHGATTPDRMFTLEEVECIAACTRAPAVQVNYRYFDSVTNADFDHLVDDLRAGRLEETVPPHGTLARVRQHVPEDRWAGTGTAPPPRPGPDPVPALPSVQAPPVVAGSSASPEPSAASPSSASTEPPGAPPARPARATRASRKPPTPEKP
jgi:NADH-quinone oxidoreductase subunit E